MLPFLGANVLLTKPLKNEIHQKEPTFENLAVAPKIGRSIASMMASSTTEAMRAFLGAIFAAVRGDRFFSVPRFAIFLRTVLVPALPRFEAFLAVMRLFALPMGSPLKPDRPLLNSQLCREDLRQLPTTFRRCLPKSAQPDIHNYPQLFTRRGMRAP